MGDYEKAAEYYDRAIAVDDRYRDAWYNKGVALDILGLSEQAQDCYNRGLAIIRMIREESMDT